MTLTKISSPTWTTCSGISTWRSASSEMWTRPSMPSSTRTNAPKGTSLVTARHDLADLVGAGELLPRVLLGRLQRQRDALAVHVDVEDLDGDLLADLDDLGRVVDVLPGQLGDVHQTVDATEVDERTEVDDAGDHAGADLALLQGRQERRADLGLGLLEPRAAGQDDVVAVLVQLDDLGLESLPTYGCRSRTRRISTSDAGRKPRRPMSRIRPPLTTSMTVPVTSFLLLVLLDRAPGALVLRPLLGQDQPASLSSFWRTRASTLSPTLTTSSGRRRA